MAPRILCLAEPWAYGPASKLLSISSILSRVASLEFCGSGTAFEFARMNWGHFQQVTKVARDSEILQVESDASLILSVMNPWGVVKAKREGKQVIYVDSLSWFWNSHLSSGKTTTHAQMDLRTASLESLLEMERDWHSFVNLAYTLSDRVFVQRYAHAPNLPEKDITQVGAIIGYERLPQAMATARRPLITLSGSLSPLVRESMAADYVRLVDLIFAKLPEMREVATLVVSPLFVSLAKPLGWKNVLGGCNQAEMLARIARASVVFAPPGLTTVLEVCASGVPIVFLPEQHDGHHANVKLLERNKLEIPALLIGEDLFLRKLGPADHIKALHELYGRYLSAENNGPLESIRTSLTCVWEILGSETERQKMQSSQFAACCNMTGGFDGARTIASAIESLIDESYGTKVTSRDQLSVGIEGELVRVETSVRIGFVGCGGHGFRNIYPCFRTMPDVKLMACCDLNKSKAQEYARVFGAPAAYDDYQVMLRNESLDAVILVLGFGPDGSPLYPEIATTFLRAGISVWMEKPPAADSVGVEGMRAALSPKVIAQVGFKKIFSPATAHIRRLLALPSFAEISAYDYFYRVDMPEEVGNLQSPAGRRFLDDFVHVASVIVDLFGLPSSVESFRSADGSGVILFEHPDGYLGTVRLAKRASRLGPVERLEIHGADATIVLENNIRVIYFPSGWRGPYGRATDHLPKKVDGEFLEPTYGPVFWEPEFSLGNLYGGSQFIQGYYHELRHFVDCVKIGSGPERGDLEQALLVMQLIDSLKGPFGEKRLTTALNEYRASRVETVVPMPKCPRTDTLFVMKDGWNYVCPDCGGSVSEEEATVGFVKCRLDRDLAEEANA